MSLVLVYNFVIIEVNVFWSISIWNVCKSTSASLVKCSVSSRCALFRCDNRYFGEHCETNYDDIVKKQDSKWRVREETTLCSRSISAFVSLDAILLFKSRFLAGCILVLIGFLLLLIALLSWFLARNNRRQQQQRNKVKQPPASAKPLIPPTKEKVRPAETSNGRLPAPPAIEPIAKSSTPPPSTLPAATLIRLSNSPTPEKRSLTPPDNIGKRNHPASFTRESSTATDDDDEPGYTSFLRHHQTLPSVPHETDEEYEERFSLQMNKSEEHGLGYLTNGFQINHVPNTDNHPTLYPFEHRTGLIKPLNIGADAPQRYTKYVSSYSKFVLPRPVQSANEYPQR